MYPVPVCLHNEGSEDGRFRRSLRGRCTPGRRLLCLLGLWLLLGTASCGDRSVPKPASPGGAGPPHGAAPSPEDSWLTVRPDSRGEGANRRIYWQASTAPEASRRVPVRWSPGPGGSPPGSVIVRTVISEDGLVLRAQILRGPKGPALEAALVEALREWRFEPARYQDRPVAVYMNLVLDIEMPS
jgi:TonB family protein